MDTVIWIKVGQLPVPIDLFITSQHKGPRVIARLITQKKTKTATSGMGCKPLASVFESEINSQPMPGL